MKRSILIASLAIIALAACGPGNDDEPNGKPGQENPQQGGPGGETPALPEYNDKGNITGGTKPDSLGIDTSQHKNHEK